MPNCFIIMPITTPSSHIEAYNGDNDHFLHVLEHLFIPAIEAIKYEPIPPIMEGSDNIQAEIIRKLEEADIVLCDMSILNPNVFFELGIRTALDKPISLVRDSLTLNIPFDTVTINHHIYKHELNTWELEEEVASLSKHLSNSVSNSDQRNPLWKYFGLTQRGEYKEGPLSPDDRLDIIMRKLDNLRTPQEPNYIYGSVSIIGISANDARRITDIVKANDSVTGALIRSAKEWRLVPGELSLGFASEILANKVYEIKHYAPIVDAVESVLSTSIRVNAYIVNF